MLQKVRIGMFHSNRRLKLYSKRRLKRRPQSDVARSKLTVLLRRRTASSAPTITLSLPPSFADYFLYPSSLSLFLSLKHPTLSLTLSLRLSFEQTPSCSSTSRRDSLSLSLSLSLHTHTLSLNSHSLSISLSLSLCLSHTLVENLVSLSYSYSHCWRSCLSKSCWLAA